MIRSRSIPTVLSRATGDGIHAVLLVDANGEVLGSYGSPPQSGANDDSSPDTNTNGKTHWPLDAGSIGALVSEVVGDYNRMGEELLLLDPQYDLHRQQCIGSRSSTDGGRAEGQEEGGLQKQQGGSSSTARVEKDGDMGVGEASSALQQTGGIGDKNNKVKRGQGSRTNLQRLVIEMDDVSL